MRKFLMILVFAVVSVFNVFSQDKIRRDYTSCFVESPMNPEVEGVYSGDNTFLFSIRESRDILHIRPNGKRVTYVRVSDIERSDPDEPVYSYFWALDENGDTVLIQIFLDESKGISIFTNISEEDTHTSFHYFNRNK